jgi:DNA repair ATPase RecN
MAEILGVVASGITVVETAGVLGTKLLALKRLWDEVKDVPETIQDLMTRIEVLQPLLDQIENDFHNLGSVPRKRLEGDESAIRCVEHCRTAVSQLSALSDELSVRINSKQRTRRGIAKVRVLIKKDILQKFEGQLQNALHLLNLAQLHYLRYAIMRWDSCGFRN